MVLTLEAIRAFSARMAAACTPATGDATRHHAKCRAPEAADAPATLITASLLHDLGHMLKRSGRKRPTLRGMTIDTKYVAIAPPARAFPAAVLAPIRMHVEQTVSLRAAATTLTRPRLPGRAISGLGAQLPVTGRVFSAAQADAFIEQPFAAMRFDCAVDDLAKVAGRPDSSLEHYLTLAAGVAWPDAQVEPSGTAPC